MTLEQFEALVLSQKPADTPWTPVTDYSFEARRRIEGIQPQLIRDVFRPKDVLDYGCGAGYLVALLAELGIDVRGYEPSEAQRALVPPYVKSRVSSNFWDNRMNGFTKDGIWDLVICREVLEHLTIRDIRETVRKLCYAAKRLVYVTTRFAKQPETLLSVETYDDLDPTHITMLNQDFLRVLFVLEGFRRRADLEAQMDWQQKGRVLVYERA